MSVDPSKTKFSTNIIAITGLLGAIGGLLTVLHTTGVIDLSSNAKNQTPQKEIIGNKLDIEDINVSDDNTLNISEMDNEESFANTEIEKPKTTIKKVTNMPNLSGYWYENQLGSRYFFSQDAGGNIAFKEFALNTYGETFVSAQGTGAIRNSSININFVSYLGYSGVFNGTVTNNGKTISGVASVPSTGESLQLTMYKEGLDSSGY